MYAGERGNYARRERGNFEVATDLGYTNSRAGCFPLMRAQVLQTSDASSKFQKRGNNHFLGLFPLFMTRMNGRTSEKRKRSTGSPDWSDNGEGGSPDEQQTGNVTSVMSITCDACRKKKVRCPSEKPSCSTCIKTGVPCVYRELLCFLSKSN